MSTGHPDISTLVRGFAQHLSRIKSADYKESQARLHYIDPFWTALGWDVSNAAQRPPQDVDVTVEPSMDTIDDRGFASREPDYRFRVNGFPRFIVEAKKPAIDHDKDGIFQAKRYAWSGSTTASFSSTPRPLRKRWRSKTAKSGFESLQQRCSFR